MAVSHSEAIERGLSFLRANQLPTGELPSYWQLAAHGHHGWASEGSSLATALSVISLARVPGAHDITAKAVRFLVAEMERSIVWRQRAPQTLGDGRSRVDLDVTACASMAVNLGGVDTGSNRGVLLASRNESGVFLTQRQFAATLWRRGARRQPRAEVADVDGVTNAHVVAYLGPEATTRAASAYLADIVAQGREDAVTKRYPDVARLYYALSTAIRQGDRILALVADLIVSRVELRLADQGDESGDLTTALLALTLDNLASRGEAYDKAVARVRAGQTANGSWGRDVLFVAGEGPTAVCASETLTTATCLEMLASAGHAHCTVSGP